MRVSLNINDKVRVQLTSLGMRIWRDSPEGRNRPVTPNGYLTEQLWVLMVVFGPEIRMGRDPVFESNVIVVSESEVSF